MHKTHTNKNVLVPSGSMSSGTTIQDLLEHLMEEDVWRDRAPVECLDVITKIDAQDRRRAAGYHPDLGWFVLFLEQDGWAPHLAWCQW